MKKTIAFVLLLLPFLIGGAQNSVSQRGSIINWLMLGPMPMEENEVAIFKDYAQMLGFQHLPIHNLEPQKGVRVQWGDQQVYQWKVYNSLIPNPYDKQIIYMAVYLQVDRWLITELTFKAGIPVAVYLDGQCLKTQKSVEGFTLPLKLSTGKHLLLIKGILLPGKNQRLPLEATLQNRDPFAADPVEIQLHPRHRLSIADLLNRVFVNAVELSPDGQRCALFLRQRKEGQTGNKSWMEIVDVNSGQTVFNSENLGNLHRFQWLKNSKSYSYTTSQKNRTSLYRFNLRDRTGSTILKDLPSFAQYQWSNNNSYLIYAIAKPVKTVAKTYKFIKQIDQRSKYPQQRYEFYIHFPKGRITRPLCRSTDEISDLKISPDDRKLLLVKRMETPGTRPYSKNIYFIMDLKTFKKEKVLETHWINDYQWSPDNKNLLLIGGPSAFKGLGKVIPEEKIPNDYDNQAYIYNLASQKATAISKNFSPAISSGFWHPRDNHIYFKVTDQSQENIYRYSLKQKTYKRINTGVDVVHRVTYADRSRRLILTGSGVATPHRVMVVNLASNTKKTLKNYNQKRYKEVRLGKVKNWDFTSDEGRTIIGRIHYPPEFNPAKKYPCIVYYYGGTSPVSRSFGGRYPKNWYAANGYVVYVLQPSGTVGFGQEFSAYHVNDWGLITSKEIITGVKKMLAAHPFIDSKRVGAIGASYGGFMTMLLGTKTDIFSALISHAGISALSSYWGVGDWGYSYSAVATANSFPWNRKDIYVGHSPLFMAERYTTPLLLLHGDIDNNVPPGESYQMYAALKLLGKEVALVTFKDQQHWILNYDQRVQWMKTIIAWYDKYLKDQPQYWEHLYGKDSAKREEDDRN